MLLGWLHEPVQFSSVDDNPTDEEREILDAATFSLTEEIELRTDTLGEELHDAKERKLPNDVIAAKRLALENLRTEVKQAKVYLRAIKDEINKGDSSALRIDQNISHPRFPYITITSLNQWARAQYRLTILPPTNLPRSDDDKPWLIPNPDDPPAKQPWYTPARYFARELVKGDPALRKNRDRLAQKIVEELKKKPIYKRGGKLQPVSGTVKKALSNIKLGEKTLEPPPKV